jgi:ABC-type branched-subunit amino acid transport system ATPase component
MEDSGSEKTLPKAERSKSNYNSSGNKNGQGQRKKNQITFFVDVQQNEVARLVGRGGANSTGFLAFTGVARAQAGSHIVTFAETPFLSQFTESRTLVAASFDRHRVMQSLTRMGQ